MVALNLTALASYWVHKATAQYLVGRLFLATHFAVRASVRLCNRDKMLQIAPTFQDHPDGCTVRTPPVPPDHEPMRSQPYVLSLRLMHDATEWPWCHRAHYCKSATAQPKDAHSLSTPPSISHVQEGRGISNSLRMNSQYGRTAEPPPHPLCSVDG